MWNDNDFDPGLGLALCSLAAVATKLQTAGPYLHTLSARPPSLWRICHEHANSGFTHAGPETPC